MTVSAAHEMALRATAHAADVLNCLDGHVKHPIRADFSPANAIEAGERNGVSKRVEARSLRGQVLKRRAGGDSCGSRKTYWLWLEQNAARSRKP